MRGYIFIVLGGLTLGLVGACGSTTGGVDGSAGSQGGDSGGPAGMGGETGGASGTPGDGSMDASGGAPADGGQDAGVDSASSCPVKQPGLGAGAACSGSTANCTYGHGGCCGISTSAYTCTCQHGFWACEPTVECNFVCPDAGLGNGGQ